MTTPDFPDYIEPEHPVSDEQYATNLRIANEIVEQMKTEPEPAERPHTVRRGRLYLDATVDLDAIERSYPGGVHDVLLTRLAAAVDDIVGVSNIGQVGVTWLEG